MLDRVSSLEARQRLISRWEAVAFPCSRAGQKPPDGQAGAALGVPSVALAADVEEPEGVLGFPWIVSQPYWVYPSSLSLASAALWGPCNGGTKHRVDTSPHGFSLGHAPPSMDTSQSSPRMTPCSSIPCRALLESFLVRISLVSGKWGRNQRPLGCGAESHQYGGHAAIQARCGPSRAPPVTVLSQRISDCCSRPQ